ncbi:hypothetical protein SUGI_0174550 [Cryptomeria japonica]|uniref:protein BIG GRAIN 1-like A n=1 Tax=Cryptomeria japonica TaxID=3369 RepID=UPI002408C9C1|nr:protein BIG GRAIN 1-like A [Cryptomeria japonica]GLJ11682.1 hypothetical protein SUGI_0174550 [Cryptomeria japonica]
MDKWEWQQRTDHTLHEAKHLKMGHSHHHDYPRSRHPSFSSALLDAICKSTEDEQGGGIDWSPQNNHKRAARLERETLGKQEEDAKLVRRRSAEIGVMDAEKCLAGHEIESLGGSMEDIERVVSGQHNNSSSNSNKQRAFQLLFQSISSAASCSSETSDNTSNWPYSSSDAESLYRPMGKYSTKTARHSEKGRKWASCMARGREWSEDLSSCAKDGGGFRGETLVPQSKSKSKSRKDSKHPKQPISPGSKLASFLNSLFMAGGTKKAKLSSSSSVSESNSYYSSQRKPASSVCSSSSSVHRSCLSKSSRGKSSNGVRRSVTFYPTSTVVDECSRPCGHSENPIPRPNPANPGDAYKKLKLHLLDKGSQTSTAKGIIAKYHKANSILEAVARELDNQEEEDDYDDDASCSSSDLFELENLAAADMNMYQKELPVYETTHLETNKAIAKGLIV